MRVALLVTDLERGGTPLRLARQARLLRDAGVEMHVGCLAPPGPVSEQLARDGIATFACGARRAWQLGALRRLADQLRAIKPDLLHCTLTHANVAGRMVGSWLRLPVIGGTATVEVERRTHRWLERMTIGSDAAHTVGAEVVRHHVATEFCYPAARIAIIPPLVAERDLPERTAARAGLGIDADRYVVLWMGRCDPVKQLEWLLPAARDSGPTALVAVVGDGPERAPLEQRVQREGLADRFRFTGWVDDPASWLAACDVVVCPSLTEGVPNAVLEGLRAGRAIVANCIPITCELQVASDAFVLAYTAEQFGGGVASLGEDAARRAELAGNAAWWAAGHLDAARTRDALLALYGAVLDGDWPPGEGGGA